MTRKDNRRRDRLLIDITDVPEIREALELYVIRLKGKLLDEEDRKQINNSTVVIEMLEGLLKKELKELRARRKQETKKKSDDDQDEE